MDYRLQSIFICDWYMMIIYTEQWYGLIEWMYTQCLCLTKYQPKHGCMYVIRLNGIGVFQ